MESLNRLITPMKYTITDDLYLRILDKSYKSDAQLPIQSLSYLKVNYYGFDEKTHIGELIVHNTIADTVLLIFEQLYQEHYPIEKIILVDDYNADDYSSMSDNNSSAFNYRMIDGSTLLSNHSQGLAIDINPLYNPYIKTVNGNLRILPPEGAPYVDRSSNNPYMIHKGDICYQTFLKYGFTWGGDWETSKDYQHFEIALPK